MIKNIIANYIGRFWSILSNFLFVPLYIHYLGFSNYSIISFTLVIAGLMAILDVGLTATLSREFARTDNSINDKIKTYKTLELTYLIVVISCIICLYTFSGVIANNWLNSDTISKDSIAYYLRIISFGVGFQLLFRFYTGGLIGLEKQVKANLYQIVWGILRNGFVVFAIIYVPSLEMFFIWQTISTIIFAFLIKLDLSKELTGSYQFGIQTYIEGSVLKRTWRFAGGMLLLTIVSSLNTQMDKLAISKLLPVENLGHYTLAISLAMGILVIVNPISAALLPRFTSLFSGGKNTEAIALYYKINRFVTIIVFSIMSILFFYPKDLIWVWTGDMFLAGEASVFLPVVSVSFAMLALAVIPFNVAIANGYTKFNNWLGIISLIVTLPGYWIATKDYGAIGAAYVFCGVQTIITIVYIYLVDKKFIHSVNPIKTYIKQLIIPLLIVFIITYLYTILPITVNQNRVFTLIWIVLVLGTSFLATLLILTPISDIRLLFRIKSKSISEK